MSASMCLMAEAHGKYELQEACCEGPEKEERVPPEHRDSDKLPKGRELRMAGQR